MPGALTIEVRLHDDRYHGSGPWPPAPARLYQALVSGCARGSTIDSQAQDWLRWFEQLPAPTIAAPHSKLGKAYVSFVPNNDLDAEGGDPTRVANIRAGKRIQPRLLAPRRPLSFLWALSDEQRSSMPCEPGVVVDQLCQFGRGIDPAWATARILDETELAEYRAQYEGAVYEPSTGCDGTVLDCPQPGTLASLEAQFAGKRAQFAFVGKGRKAKQLFARAAKPSFARVSYDAPPARQLFELRHYEGASRASTSAPQRLATVSALVVKVRDLALEQLTRTLPTERALWAEHALRGRDNPHLTGGRCRLIPLPSIGHEHADRLVRRLLVEVPGDCLVSAGDIFWAFSGLSLSMQVDEETKEVLSETRLVAASEETALRHFAVGERARSATRFRTMTPAVLPESARRRRIEPTRQREEAKAGAEFAQEHRRAIAAVRTALRHAGVDTAAARIAVRRQPFDRQGEMAERFAEGTRFAKERLWHLELEFAEPVQGPLVIGDGRYLGLGVLAPVYDKAVSLGVLALQVSSTDGSLERSEDVARAFRRASIARVQKELRQSAKLAAYFHGHDEDGKPLQAGHAHLSFQVDPVGRRLLVLAPRAFTHQQPLDGARQHWAVAERAVGQMTTLVAGSAGAYRLTKTPTLTAEDPLLRESREWMSVTEYTPTRYGKSGDTNADLVADVRAELARRGLPEAEVEVRSLREGRRGGLRARLVLRFRRAVHGPIALGRTSHLGGGLFTSSVTIDSQRDQH